MPGNDLDGEWLEALQVEAPPEDKSAEDKSAEDTSTNDKKEGDDNDDSSNTDNGDGSSDSDDNSDDGTTGGHKDDSKEETKEEPTEKDSTKEAIKEALQEIDTDKKTQADTVQAFKKEVTEKLYPEGIDRQLRDSDGDPITGIDDLTKLINPRTGELFTDEQAGSWLLQAQQKLNKDIETVENFIEQVAEVNASVKTGAERVAVKYGEILKADDALRTRLINAYDSTLVKDPATGVTINNPVDVVEFFDIALEHRMNAKVEADQAAAAQAKADAEKAAKDGQSDRGDLKPNGKGDNIDPEDKEWAEAYKNYEGGK